MFLDINERKIIMKKLFLITTLLISFSTAAFSAHPGGTVYADVNGLVCDFCARALEKVFGKQEAVESRDVDLDKKVITIHFNEGQKLAEEVITKLSLDSGYNVREIRYEK
jgi:copper chaperone CopZ